MLPGRLEKKMTSLSGRLLLRRFTCALGHVDEVEGIRVLHPLWHDKAVDNRKGTPASLKKMTTPFRSNYACGLEVVAFQGHKGILHGGGIEGFSTSLSYFPDEKGGPLTIVVPSNAQSNVEQVAQNLAKGCLDYP